MIEIQLHHLARQLDREAQNWPFAMTAWLSRMFS